MIFLAILGGLILMVLIVIGIAKITDFLATKMNEDQETIFLVVSIILCAAYTKLIQSAVIHEWFKGIIN